MDLLPFVPALSLGFFLEVEVLQQIKHFSSPLSFLL